MRSLGTDEVTEVRVGMKSGDGAEQEWGPSSNGQTARG